jgi:Flp pilus assembly protein TadB
MEKSTEDKEQITIEGLNKKIDDLTTMIRDRDREAKTEFRFSVVFVCFGFALSYYSLGSGYIGSSIVFFVLGILLMFINPISKFSRRVRKFGRSLISRPSEGQEAL